MTVADLRKYLDGLPDTMQVLVYNYEKHRWEPANIDTVELLHRLGESRDYWHGILPNGLADDTKNFLAIS